MEFVIIEAVKLTNTDISVSGGDGNYQFKHPKKASLDACKKY